VNNAQEFIEGSANDLRHDPADEKQKQGREQLRDKGGKLGPKRGERGDEDIELLLHGSS
jgi:hypothetical protein